MFHLRPYILHCASLIRVSCQQGICFSASGLLVIEAGDPFAVLSVGGLIVHISSISEWYLTMVMGSFLFLITTLLSLLASFAVADGNKTLGVTYDGRSLIINGKREILFSGSIHYTRSTPDVSVDLCT